LLTPGWNNVEKRHPQGAPLGLAVAEDGAIWVAEDRNATILRIARDRP
jgi:glucose/arabinose dehydrogenase